MWRISLWGSFPGWFKRKGSVFAILSLRGVNIRIFFNQLKVTDGFVPWSDEIDLAPGSMYRAISLAGAWLLSWNEFSRAARAALPCETHPDSAGHSAMMQPSSADITNILFLAYSAKQSF